jgi:ligand-binding sensor domain-containing protein
MKKISIILLFLLIPIQWSLNQSYTFQKIGLKDGLPMTMVMSVLQDQDGFLWMNTVAGLYRYDGYSFHSIPKSIISINKIELIDKKGFL